MDGGTGGHRLATETGPVTLASQALKAGRSAAGTLPKKHFLLLYNRHMIFSGYYPQL
jgi:hypothetical protein